MPMRENQPQMGAEVRFDQVMKMISLSNIGRVITPCNTDVECTSSREDLPPTFRDASIKSELLMMKRNSIEYSFNSSAPFSV